MPDIRIVSLLPSATEIVCALGSQKYLVGVSHECDYPAGVTGLPTVTSTAIPKGLDSKAIDEKVRELLQTDAALYNLNVDALLALKPTHIVTQAICDVCAVSAAEVEGVTSRLPGNPQVVNLEPMSLQQVLDTFALIGAATQRESEAASVVQALQARVDIIAERSAEIADSALHEAQPDVLFVALCGFDVSRTEQDLPLLERLPGWADLPCVRDGRVYYTDGNAYFSRAGPRLVESLEVLAHALHPDVHPLSPSGDVARIWEIFS